MTSQALTIRTEAATEPKLAHVVAASTLGTLLTWYDFYLYSALAPLLADKFFPADKFAGLASLGLVGTGFVMRPLGALVFGYLGDRRGRKFPLVLTLLLIGGSTVVMGLLPGYATLGALAPVLLVLVRLVQGLALGGEYGGAAIYIAEHAPDGKRGLYTSWLQTTASLGIVLALLVILFCRAGFGEQRFGEWAWRVPFLISAVLLLLAVFIRLRLEESPLYARIKEQAKTSENPLRDSFSTWQNGRLMLLALFGAAAPEAVVWYAGQFYALYYLSTVLQIPDVTVYIVMIVALTLGAPLFVVVGALSDKIGRRNIMTLGFLLAAVTFWPVFSLLGAFKTSPTMLTVLVLYLTVLAALAYGPLAAFLVELFPGRIRYTSVSLSYHIGNGIFGGLVPVAAIAFGSGLSGLLYPIGIAAIGVVVSIAALPERSDQARIWDEAGAALPPPGRGGG
jgi:MFS family permease